MILQYGIQLQNMRPKFHHDLDHMYGHLMKPNEHHNSGRCQLYRTNN